MPAMKANRYLGQTLKVDLSTGKVATEPLDNALVQKFVGGFGVISWNAYNLIPRGVDPLSAENPIVFGAGALGGTLAPGSSKIMAVTRFPVNGTIGMASGGSGGDTLRYAGYHQFTVVGKAPSPVVLKIWDDDIELLPAGELWGKDIAQTTDQLKKQFGDECTVIAIGPPGERLSTISMAFVNKGGNLGKGGLGAVMGSKNLKAILIRGTRGVRVSDVKRFTRTVDPLFEAMLKLPYRNDWLGMGVSISYWGRRSTWSKTPSEAQDPYGTAEFEKVWRWYFTCPTCPMSCKAWVETPGGRMAPLSGTMLPVRIWREFAGGNVGMAYQLSDLCNRNGIDHWEVAGLIKLLITLFQDGVINLEDTDGLALKKDYETVAQLLDKLVRREGIGDLIADGIPALVKAFGKEVTERAVLIKGVHPLEDPRRHFHGWSVDEIVNPRHPVGQPGNSPAFFGGRPLQEFVKYLERLHVPREAIERVCASNSVNMARLTRYAEDFYSTCSCLGVCIRVPLVQTYSLESMAELWSAASGLEISPAELMKAGERAWNIIKMANVREGFSRKDDKIPQAFLQPLVVEGKTFTLKDYYGNPLSQEAIERLIDDYYQERGWTTAEGIPTREKLTELGLEKLAADLPPNPA